MSDRVSNTSTPALKHESDGCSSRMLCVWLPNFPIQRLRCKHFSEACVLYADSGSRTLIVAASNDARLHGIRSGMSLAEAQALHESAVFLPHDAVADASELKSLAELCYRYSPLIGLELSDDAHCLLLDISGCGHLFDGESGLARHLVVDLAERGYFAHVAIARTIGAAWAIARYGHCTGSDRRLKSLPVQALRIPDKLVSRLCEFDLQTIGQLDALPRNSLPSRFGKLINERLGQIFGHRPELLVFLSRLEPASAEWTTNEAICHPKAIQHVCTELLAELLETLKNRSEGLLRLTLRLESDTSASAVLKIGLARPTDSLKHILHVVQLKLDTSTIPEWIHSVHLEASDVSSLQVQQRSLFSSQEPIANGGSAGKLADRLIARLGNDGVVHPRVLPEAVPEQASSVSPLSEPFTEMALSAGLQIASARPVFLRRPETIQVTAIAKNGTPLHFGWSGRCYQIVCCTTVERIATGWWQESGSIQRDYYQAETQSGARFWLFRDRTGEWFLHGVFE